MGCRLDRDVAAIKSHRYSRLSDAGITNLPEVGILQFGVPSSCSHPQRFSSDIFHVDLATARLSAAHGRQVVQNGVFVCVCVRGRDFLAFVSVSDMPAGRRAQRHLAGGPTVDIRASGRLRQNMAQ